MEAREIHNDFDRFLEAKRKESQEYKKFVENQGTNPGLRITEWEIRKYFDL